MVEHTCIKDPVSVKELLKISQLLNPTYSCYRERKR